jgi:peroxiredoxin Q/BCP
MNLEKGDKLPEFELKNQDRETVSSSDIEDAVIYFYPKAGTPGCTNQACDLRDKISELENAGITVYGISTDSVEKQKKFHEENNLNFDLLADSDKKVARKFGVFRKAMRVAERTTFLVRDGEIVQIFEKVDPDEHIKEVLDYLN